MKTRLAALALASLALACADNAASIQPFAICAPPDASGADCVFESTCTMVHMGPLRIDPSLTATLSVYMQVNNQLPDNTDLSAGRLNTNDAYVTEYEVEYDGAASGTSAGHTQAMIPADGSTVVGLLLQPPLVAGQLVAKLKLKGRFADQSTFETAAYETPIIVGPVGPPQCPTGETVVGTCGGTVGQVPLGVACAAPTTTTTTP
ncbi:MULTISPECIES: hypothetical protein [Anaeromyxobacter]|uniref:hypothetical protein n=1 Tax=Anaeromyxobacter TaxID=161492 RepID=UPI001F571F88|nr:MULTISPECIES: hypothetical protein [unclassified Anaeromyxobacter]